MGLSDHTMGWELAQHAAGHKGDYVWFEKHFKLDRIEHTPDAYHAKNPKDFSRYVAVVEMTQRRFQHDKTLLEAEKKEVFWMQRGKDGLRPADAR